MRRFLFVVGMLCIGTGAFVLVYLASFSDRYLISYDRANAQIGAAASSTGAGTTSVPTVLPLDRVAYDLKLLQLAHRSATTSIAMATSSVSASSTIIASTTTRTSKTFLWPAKALYPNAGALLPFNRIVAYYGNFYSKGMGVLGKYPPDVMLAKLKAATAEWQAADPSMPVIPGIDYIAVTAQGSPVDGKYRARMPDDQIEKAISLAGQVHGIVILDVQVGLSTVQTEVPLLEKYLKLPNVHLALDPEFSMKDGRPPGREIGTMNPADINFAANFLARLVQQNNLPPKILVIHRFTEDMVTHYKEIKPLPEVEIVMDMDGWGFAAKKINTYQTVIYPEPVQFTGFKLFYKNDLLPPSTRMLTPKEILKLTPSPSFIQYQ